MTQKQINEQEWKNPDNWSGCFYFSKKDDRTWVPKTCLWMSWTLNIGKLARTRWLLGFIIGMPAFMFGVLILSIFIRL